MINFKKMGLQALAVTLATGSLTSAVLASENNNLLNNQLDTYIENNLVQLAKSGNELALERNENFIIIPKTGADDRIIIEAKNDGVEFKAGPVDELNTLGSLSKGETFEALLYEKKYVKFLVGGKLVYSNIDNFNIITPSVVANSGSIQEKEKVKKLVAQAEEKARKEAEEKARKEAEEKARKEAERKARKSKEKKNTKKKSNSSSNSSQSLQGSNSIVNTALKYNGYRYVAGGASPSGFDCSGFVQYVFKQNGISMPRTARDQYRRGTKSSYSNMKPGDLMFFGKSSSSIFHVGIYIGNGKYIHASTPKTGVKIASVNSSWVKNNIYGVKTVR